MKKLGLYSLALALGMQAAVVFSQAQERPTPTFALSIKEQPLSVQNAPGTHLISVTYTNISNVPQKDGCAVSPAAYKMTVLRDGLAVEMRKPKEQPEERNESNQGSRIHVTYTERDSCHGINEAIKPGASVKFTLWASSEYDMSTPGSYDVTVTRETDRGNPERSVTVKSNTITIDVPTTDNPPPADK